MAPFTAAVEAGYRAADALLQLALLARTAGDQKTALRHFEAAAKAQSDAPEVYRALGHAKSSAGDLDGAAAMWERVLALVPGDAAASFRLGKLRLQQGRPDAARPLLEHAVQAHAFAGRAHRALAKIALMQQDGAAALLHFAEATKIVSPEFDLFADAGRAALQAGQDDLAFTYLTRALAFRPGDGSLCLALGELELRRKRPRQARAFLTVALAQGQEPSLAQRRLGEAAAALGDDAAAVTHLEAALGKNGHDATVLLLLGDALAKLGRREEAAKRYAAATRAAAQTGDLALGERALKSGWGVSPDSAELKAAAEVLAKRAGVAN